MNLIDAVKQLLSGDRKFSAADESVATEAANVIDIVKNSVKGDAKQEAEEAVNQRMLALETAETDVQKKIDAVKTETATALETERARVDGVLAAAAPLRLIVEDWATVLGPKADGEYMTLEQAQKKLIEISGKQNAGLKGLDGRRETPDNEEEAQGHAAMDTALERRRAPAGV